MSLYWLMEATRALLHFIAVNNYLALFVLILIEEAGCPLPLPGESLIIFAGSRIALGRMRTSLVFLSVLPASAIGCTILYFLARTGGRALVHRYGHRIHFDDRQLAKAEAKVARIGPVAVLLGRLTPGIRVPTDVAAGIFRIPFHYYLPFALLATSIRLAFFLYIGASAQHLRFVILQTREAKFMTTGIVLLLAIVAGWTMWRRHRRRPAPQPPVPAAIPD